MQNRRRSSFLMSIIIFLVVGPLEANVVRSFEGTGETLDIFILRLGGSERARQGAIAAIEELEVSDDKIVLAWAHLARLLSRGGILDYPDNVHRWRYTTNAVFRLIDLDKALAGLLDSLKSGNRDESILARFAIKEITDRLKNSTVEPPPGTVPHFEGTGETLDIFILRLGDEKVRVRQGAIAAIEGLGVPDDRIVLAWANLTRLLGRGEILGYYLFRWNRTTDAVFRLIDLDKALAGLLDSLKSGNRDESILARFVIKEITDRLRNATLEPPPCTVPLLVEVLQDKDVRIREIASQLLGLIPSKAKAAVPQLIHVLTDENEDVRSVAVSTLGRIAVAIPKVQPEITERLMDLTDESPAVRSAIVSALGDIAVATPGAQLKITEKLIEMLNAPNVVIYGYRRHSNFHVEVAEELASIGPAAVPSLLKALNTTGAEVRHHAAIALARMDSPAAEATIPILIQALASPHPNTRWTAVEALVKMAKWSKLVNQILQALVQVIDATEDTVENRVARPEAAHTLREIAVAMPAVQPEIIEELISALNTPNFVSGHFGDDRSDLSNFHVGVADELASLGSTVVPSLLKALNAADGSVRHHAAIALAQLNSQPDEAIIRIIPILTEALASPYLHTRAEAVWVLGKLGERPTLVGQIAPIFVKVLETTTDTEPIHYDLTFHDIVASALASIDLSETIKVLRSDNAYVQRYVVAAIAPMNDPAVDETVPILIELLCSDDRYVRQAAMETLTQLRQFSTDDLIAALTDENGCIRTRSAIVLVEIGPAAMAVLAETLSHQSPETSQRIIEILETVATPAARRAISAYQRSGQ